MTAPKDKKKAPKPRQGKSLEQYQQTRPEQLTFFELISPEDRRFSNTIELYDFMPKYNYSKVERINGKFLNALQREFECRGHHYRLEIKPASLRDKQGNERYYYPSKREELVEEALRKLASEGQGVFLDDQAGVTFSLYQLQQELKRTGHSYSKDEIKDALQVCAQSSLVLTSDDGSAIMIASLFETVGLKTHEDWAGQGEKSRAFVRFNPLVTASIKNKSFRLYNYEASMSYSSVIARQMHKRLAHHYTQASLANPYRIGLKTIIRDFGLTAYERLSHNLRDVVKALDEMKEKNVIAHYHVTKTVDPAQRNKLVDAMISIAPHPTFTNEVIEANKRSRIINTAPPKDLRPR
jgi:hypothetical protein